MVSRFFFCTAELPARDFLLLRSPERPLLRTIESAEEDERSYDAYAGENGDQDVPASSHKSPPPSHRLAMPSAFAVLAAGVGPVRG